MNVQTKRDISTTVENIKLLLSDNRKSYMPRRLAQQRMTLSDHEQSFHASRAISAVAEILVNVVNRCLRSSREMLPVWHI